MSDDDEDIIIIEDGRRKEEFSVVEANDASTVQARFNLESKPPNVISISNKEVQFGKLKNGKVYKLPILEEIEDEGVIIEEGFRKEEFTVEEANKPAVVQVRFDLDKEPPHVLNLMNKEIQFGKLRDGMIYKLCKSIEEELGIVIEDGPIKKTFKVTEANNPEVVQKRFGLDNLPQNVLNIREKAVPFGKLMDGMTYKLPKSQILIPYQKAHTYNAIILSKAVKASCPADIINKHYETHTIMSVCGITKYSDQKVLLAIGEVAETNVLYVAYERNSSGDDISADMNSKWELKNRENTAGGKIHAKFDERAKTVSIEYILKCAQEKKCNTIVTCGHSVGGCVSSIVAIDLMDIEDRPAVFNITFGAPFFGNEALRRMCKAAGFERRMVHYVDFLDLVPGLLYLGPTTQMIRSKSVQIPDKKLVDNCIKFNNSSEKFVKFLIENISNYKASIADEDSPSGFISMCSEIMEGFETTGLDHIFSPIGNFIRLRNGLPIVLDAESSSEQLKENILKDPYTKVKSISEIKDRCSLDTYYKNLASNHKVDLPPRRIDYEEEFFEPKIDGKGSIVWTKYEDGKWRCQLAVRGQFLKSLQITSPSNDFAGMPFKSTSTFVNVNDGKHEAVYLSEETTEMDIQIHLGEIVELKLATPFGIIKIPSQIRMSSLVMDYRNISVEEPVATILNKSVSRSLAIVGIVDGEKKHDKSLKSLIDIVVGRLEDHRYRQKYHELFKYPNPLSRKDDISKITEKIIESITKEIVIHYETDFKRYKEVRTKKEMGFNGKKKEKKGLWESIGMYFSWLFGLGEEVEEDYVEQLSTVINEITSSDILQTNTERDDILGEITKQGIYQQSPKSAYLLELLLMSYEKERGRLKSVEICAKGVWDEVIKELVGPSVKQEQLIDFLHKEHLTYDEFINEVDNITGMEFKVWQHGQYTSEVHEMLLSLLPQWKEEVKSIMQARRNQPAIWTTTRLGNYNYTNDSFPRKSDEILTHLKEKSKMDVENKIRNFRKVYEIRKLYGKQCYIGFIGPQNAGKSTLLNALFGKAGETGMWTHTQKPTKYNVSDDIFAIDFPGSDSISDQMCASLESSGHMNNFQIFVMQYNGKPNKQMIANVKLAYRLKKASGKASKTIFCLNKASALISEDSDKLTDQHRSKYVQQIRDHIESHSYDEKEESLWKRIKEGTSEKFGSKVYDDIARINEELKEYTLKELNEDDFLFTDWKDKEAHKKGIVGPEEIRNRIRMFLVKHNIRTEDNVMDI